MMSWLSRALGLRTTEKRSSFGAGGGWLQAPSASGVTVTPDTALTYSAVFAAINAISSDIASLPFKVYKRTGAAGKVEDPDHPLYDLLVYEPSDEVDSFHFEQTLVSHALSYGNGYAEITRTGSGEVESLYLLDPKTTQPARTKSGKLVYQTGEDKTLLLPENCLHLKGLAFDGIQGYSPITLARQSIGLGLASELFGASFYGNSAIPSGFLKVTNPKMSAEAKSNLRDEIQNMHGGPYNAHRLGILDGLEWEQTSISPENAQFLGTRQFNIIEICRWFNINPIRLQDYTHGTFANVEQAALDYVNTTLAPWIANLESEVMRKLLSRDERKVWFARHDLTERLRGDTEARTSYYRELSGIGVFSINEIRASEGLNGIGPDGDKHYVPLNMVAAEDPPEAPAEPTPEPQAPAEPTPPTPSLEAQDAVRAVLVDCLGRLARREATALRRALRKPEAGQAVHEFYAGHGPFVRESITPALRAYNLVSGRDVDPEDLVRILVEDSGRDFTNLVGDPEEAEQWLTQVEDRKAESVVQRIEEDK